MRERTFAQAIGPPDNCRMGSAPPSLRQLLKNAAETVEGLLDADGEVNTSAMARHTAKQGHPVSQATLHRIYNAADPSKPHRMKAEVVEALHLVFGIPRSMLRGEPMSAELEEILGRVPLTTLLLAEKLQKLDPKVRNNIKAQIDLEIERQAALKRAQTAGNVTPIRRPPTN